jgi:copper chaperone
MLTTDNLIMETLKFKTNIKCDGCISAVTPYLNELVDVVSWSADLNSPDRILTVNGQEGMRSEEIIVELQKAGYQAEEV